MSPTAPATSSRSPSSTGTVSTLPSLTRITVGGLADVSTAATGAAVGEEMAMYSEALRKVGVGGHALAGAHNGG